MRYSAIFIVLLVLLAIASCSNSDELVCPAPTDGPLLAIDMVLNDGVAPARIDAGDRMNIRLRIVTVGDEDVELQFRAENRMWFQVLSGDSVALSWPMWSWGTIPSVVVVRPSDATELTLDIPTQVDDLAALGDAGFWGFAEDELAPGEYTIQAGLIDTAPPVHWKSATFEVQ